MGKQRVARTRFWDDKLIGESEYVDSFPELECMVSSLRDSVLKAPWSSSGREIRYAGSTLDDHQQGWAKHHQPSGRCDDRTTL